MELLGGFVGVVLHEVDASEDVLGAGVVALGVGEGFFCEFGGGVEVALHEVELGEIHAFDFARAGGGPERVGGDVFDEDDLFGVFAFAFDVHAVDHGGDLVAEAVSVLFHDL